MHIKDILSFTIDFVRSLKFDWIPDHEIDRWITTDTGAHVPIRKGQTEEQAIDTWKKEKGIIDDTPKLPKEGGVPIEKGLDIDEGIRVRNKLTQRMKETDFEIDYAVGKPGQSSGVYVVKLPNGARAIWKEKDGLRPRYLRDKILPREVAAYEVDRLLGVNLSAPVVMREYKGKEGYLQGFSGRLDVRDMRSPYAALKQIDNNEIARAALFDYVLNQRDRYSGNFRVTELTAGKYKLRLIDNSSAFGHEKDKLQAFHFLHEAIRRDVKLSRRMKTRIDEVTADVWYDRLSPYLDPVEIKEAWERLDNVKEVGLVDAIEKRSLVNWKPRRK